MTSRGRDIFVLQHHGGGFLSFSSRMWEQRAAWRRFSSLRASLAQRQPGGILFSLAQRQPRGVYPIPPLGVEVLACLYRQRDQLGNSRGGLVCLLRSQCCHAESILINLYDTLISKQPGPVWFFYLHACTWAGDLYGVCWDSNANSLQHAADKKGH
jgi:hypothetical protein